MELLFLFILILFLCQITWYSWKYGITPTPTSFQVQRVLLDAFPKQIEGTIVELGSGWGLLAWSIAKRYPQNPVIGYEISPIPYLFSWCWNKIFPQPNLHFERKDFFSISLKEVAVVVCYLYPGAMRRLKLKFEEELLLDTLIISHTFAVPGWVATRTDVVNDLYRTPVYVYQIKKITDVS